MFKKELCSILTFYAVSPIHAGSGTAVATVDLPIQRERHTGWPHIQASEVKGALRSHFRNFCDETNTIDNNTIKVINLIFGSDEQDGWDKNKENLPGSISVSDAKLLAFPMRSNITPFIWVTCPAIIKRLKTDLSFVNIEQINGEFDISDDDKALVIIGSNDLFKTGDKIILEDAIVNIENNEKKEIGFINNNFPEIDKLLLVSDDTFDYCVSFCTEIQTQIKIDTGTGITKDGSLRYQELLPADSALYSVVYYSKGGLNDMQAENIKKFVEGYVKDFIQIGGDETLGRGICKANWYSKPNNAGE